MSQSAIKVPGPDKINFQIIQMLQVLNKKQITNMIKPAIWLEYYLKV